MDNDNRNYPNECSYAEYPAFSWMYEEDRSISQATRNGTTHQKQYNKDTSQRSLNDALTLRHTGITAPGRRTSSSSMYGLERFSSPSASVPPSSLAYVDPASQSTWPIPSVTGFEAPMKDFTFLRPSNSALVELESHYRQDAFPAVSVPAEECVALEQPAFSDVPRASSQDRISSSSAYAVASAASATATSPSSSSSSSVLEREALMLSKPDDEDMKASSLLSSLSSPILSSRRRGHIKHSNHSAIVGLPKQDKVEKRPRTKHCAICGKKLLRDLTRHMRIHEAVADFACPFPRVSCSHKHGQFNRPYEYKKHLMNCHFIFDDPKAAKSAQTLNEKLALGGKCKCGVVFEQVGDWINEHIRQKKCPLLESNINTN